VTVSLERSGHFLKDTELFKIKGANTSRAEFKAVAGEHRNRKLLQAAGNRGAPGEQHFPMLPVWGFVHKNLTKLTSLSSL